MTAGLQGWREQRRRRRLANESGVRRDGSDVKCEMQCAEQGRAMWRMCMIEYTLFA